MRKNSIDARRYSTGFSLVTAIFLLVVIAALGVFVVTLSTTQQQSAALDVLGTRAYQAARAGVDWGAYQVIQSEASGGAFASACQAGPTSRVVAMPNTLAVFSVNVECSATVHAEGNRPQLWIYQLTSTASGVTGAAPGSSDYIERQMRVSIAP